MPRQQQEAFLFAPEVTGTPSGRLVKGCSTGRAKSLLNAGADSLTFASPPPPEQESASSGGQESA